MTKQPSLPCTPTFVSSLPLTCVCLWHLYLYFFTKTWGSAEKRAALTSKTERHCLDFLKNRNNTKINIPNQLLPVEVYNQQRLPRRKMYIASSRTRRNDFNAEFNENIEGALVTVARAAFQGTVDPHCFRGMPAVLSKPLERPFFRSCFCNVILCVD